MYITRSENELKEMLKRVGVESVDELLTQVPGELLRSEPLGLPPPMSEMEMTAHVKGLAGANAGASAAGKFAGCGAYDHYVPSAVRHLVSRAEFLTAYTPYQPEVSQGTLQAIFEYQSMVCALTGMEVSNASLYDGASGLAEAVLMARSVTGKPDVVFSGTVRPRYRDVVSTYVKYLNPKITVVPESGGRPQEAAWGNAVTGDTAAVVVQSPNMYGIVEDPSPAVEAAHAAGALVIVVCDLVSLSLLKPPGDFDADIAVGEGQPAAGALSFGGPYLGFLACRRAYIRKMPGRIIAETIDVDGARGYVMTLQTREQHIRRERATSNICTNQGLVALSAAIHIGLMGPEGLRRAAESCVRNAAYAAERLAGIDGFSIEHDGPYFREFPLRTPIPPGELNARLAKKGIVGGVDMGMLEVARSGLWLVCVTEKHNKKSIDAFADAVEEVCAQKAEV
jgi:glycine dehydrogenase subunit 1